MEKLPEGYEIVTDGEVFACKKIDENRIASPFVHSTIKEAIEDARLRYKAEKEVKENVEINWKKVEL